MTPPPSHRFSGPITATPEREHDRRLPTVGCLEVSGEIALIAELSMGLKFGQRFCDRARWLHHGRQMVLGPTGEVPPRYEAFES